MNFNHVVCGGTFDHLHRGHKKLLKNCFIEGKKVTIGLASGALLRHKQYKGSIQSYTLRKKQILDYALSQQKEVTVVRLTNIFGPTITDNSFEALFVTKDTAQGAKMINIKRKELGMKPLSVRIIPFVYDESHEKISSERIRQGVISRDGKSYYSCLLSKEEFILPDSLKRELRHPMGRIFSSFSHLPQRYFFSLTTVCTKKTQKQNNQHSIHISIGDVITGELQKNGIFPSISVIDGKTQRKALTIKELSKIKQLDCSYALNPKGAIQRHAVKEIYTLLAMGHSQATKQLYIDGEEDLLTLPFILFAPLGSYIWYGQRGVGAVCVKVTEKQKEKVYNLLQKFD